MFGLHSESQTLIFQLIDIPHSVVKFLGGSECVCIHIMCQHRIMHVFRF